MAAFSLVFSRWRRLHGFFVWFLFWLPPQMWLCQQILALLNGADEYKSNLLHVKKLWGEEPTEFGAGYTFSILETV
jgi:hypothetical protein